MNEPHPIHGHRRGILTLALMLAFLLSLAPLLGQKGLFHGGGMVIMGEMARSLFAPNLSEELLILAVDSTWRTLCYALTGLCVAIIIGLLLGIPASGIYSRRHGNHMVSVASRGLLGALRSVHELVWAWLFVASIGLSPIAAIMAIAIPYGGILGRVYADMLADVPKEPIEALRICGANEVQQFFYGYLPLASSNMLSYTLYRFECAIRSSSIMSFVGLGGLGYQIQRYLDDLDYPSVWTLLLFLIGIVVLVDLWSSFMRKHMNEGHVSNSSMLVFAALTILAWGFVIGVDGLDLSTLWTEKNMGHATSFLHSLAGGDAGLAYFMDADGWRPMMVLTVDTLSMSIMAIGFASIAALLTLLPASRNVADGTLFLQKSPLGMPMFLLTRGVFIFTRALPELIWAMVIIFVFKPGIMPAAIALAIHNYGILGKLFAEVVEDMDQRPVKNLVACGANRLQIVFYAIVPAIMPKILTYILYRWEVIMRTTIVVGFVGASGLGQHFRMSMSLFRYGEVTRTILCYLVLVVLADLISSYSRKFIST